MEIVDWRKSSVAEFKILFAFKRLIVLDLIETIKSAPTLGDLIRLDSCEQESGYYFVFNNVCKLYFERIADPDKIRLLGFEFVNDQ